MVIKAPPDWVYHSFPLPDEGTTVLSLDWVCEIGHALMDRAETTGDQAHFGPVPHWAHLLKIEQRLEGDWPLCVDARTGRAIGDERTREPAALLERLGGVLRSSEFDGAVERARIRRMKGTEE